MEEKNTRQFHSIEIEMAAQRTMKNPAFKKRVIAALKAGGREAIKEITNNPYMNILLAAYEGWRNPF